MRKGRVEQLRRRQKSVVYTGLQAFQAVLLLLQLYLFVSTLETMLTGKFSTAIPSAAFSLVILSVNVWILAGINRVEGQR
ncbi:MAG: DUF6755 family protein [Fimbriimonadaceae bacterium]